MEMEDQYCMPDLRQLMNSRSHFPSIQPTPELFPSHRGMAAPAPAQPYEMLMMGRHQVSDMLPRGLHHQDHQFSSDYTTAAAVTATTTAAISCGVGGGSLDADLGCLGGDGGTGRWPRQETLTLLEIRSRLDPKFKEANQKGPLWDEVSRIMSEEHGYQRSGKKCREKFENLYKYYKKTKEGKAGRQDGKHYRFFRQLEALYGESTTTTTPISAAADAAAHLLGTTANPHRFISQASNHQLEGFHHAPKLSESLSLSNNSSELDTSSSDYDDDDAALAEDDDAAAGAGDGRSEKGKKKRNGGGGGRKGSSWKAKIKEFVDGQMQRLLEKQEAWLEKMLATLEQKEQERLLRDEEWRRQEAARLDREHHFWASERAWIKARDAALMEALHKFTGRGDLLLRPTASSSPDHPNDDLMDNGNNNNHHHHHHHHAAAAHDNAAAPPDPAAASEHLGGDDEWSECEVTRLIQLRTGMEGRFRQTGCPEEVLWEEIASEMGCLGYDRSAPLCRDKWNDINASYLGKANTTATKKRKETSAPSSPRSCCYFPTAGESLYVGIGSGPAGGGARSPANNNGGGQDGCFRFLMGDGGESLWDNYGLKLKGSDHN